MQNYTERSDTILIRLRIYRTPRAPVYLLYVYLKFDICPRYYFNTTGNLFFLRHVVSSAAHTTQYDDNITNSSFARYKYTYVCIYYSKTMSFARRAIRRDPSRLKNYERLTRWVVRGHTLIMVFDRRCLTSKQQFVWSAIKTAGRTGALISVTRRLNGQIEHDQAEVAEW